ncbi:MAG: hypothetical protein CMD92_01865 [Gammaproteobacteria bacterium]|nr:hypothetical protein [Gammaproteobacteria bacterium]
MKLETVEDYLEVLAGLQNNHKIKIEQEDCTILYSIARQVFRGKAFTDRQLDVVCLKLNYYSKQFTDIGYTNLQEILAMRITRTPLRTVDRSQWIKIVDEPERNTPQFATSKMGKKSKTKELAKDSHIAVRFPFSKKIILLIEKLAYNNKQGYYHEKGSHVHYFKITENSVYDIVETFKNKSYDIDERLLEYTKQVKAIKDQPEKYIPGVYNFELMNTTKSLQEKIKEHLGELTKNNIHLYKDRSLLYGLEHFDDIHSYVNQTSVLTQRIIKRIEPSVFISKNEWSLDAVISSLTELKRFPLLIVIPEDHPLDYISYTYQSIKGFVGKNKICTMFRLDNKTDKEFNDYIKDNKLNNPLAKDTEVVYISSNKKFPKPLFESDWQAESVLLLQSVRNPKLDPFFDRDLVIHFDEVESQMGSYRNMHIAGQIQKI